MVLCVIGSRCVCVRLTFFVCVHVCMVGTLWGWHSMCVCDLYCVYVRLGLCVCDVDNLCMYVCSWYCVWLVGTQVYVCMCV